MMRNGLAHNEVITCPVCNGSGRNFDEFDYSLIEVNTHNMETCESCGGSGKIEIATID